MAQSSSYKQYNRSTRILTEESGFAGGMFWTGNNIDETHLKAIVNCDYDDTTGYLKTRDSFEPVVNTPSSEELKDLNVDLTNVKLMGVYNICAFKDDDTLTDAGQLYIFTRIDYIAGEHTNLWRTDLSYSPGGTSSVDPSVVPRSQTTETTVQDPTKDTTVALFQDRDAMWHKCNIDVIGGELRNINKSQLLTVYDNYLYGLGNYSEKAPTSPEYEWERPNTLGLQVYRLNYDEEEDSYSLGQFDYNNYILPRINDVTLLEAYTSGFNAARGKDTFAYTGKQVDSARVVGVYYTEKIDGQLQHIVSPRSGHTVTVNVVTDYEADPENKVNYLTVFQLVESTNTSETNNMWQIIGGGPFSSTDGVYSFEYQFQKKETTLLFTCYGVTKPSDTPTAYDEAARDYLGPLVVTANDTRSNLKLKTYNLRSVNGSCQWRNRLCLWGAEGNNNCLFLSEVDNFYYFPVPNNVAVFDSNVISCIPYKDTLLVFTADKIYRMSENNDGTFTQTVIQNDMPLSKADAPYLTAIKNMVLFKSGNYFYMIVPKSQSLTDELIIAPIYKNIAGFLNTLDKSVLEILQLVYPEYLFNSDLTAQATSPVTLYSVYSAQDTVHIVYDVVANVKKKSSSNGQTLLFKLFLNYNTNLRAWTLYIEDTSKQTLEVAALTPARQMSFVRVFTDVDAENRGGFSIVTQSYAVKPTSEFRILLDTGYRTLSSAMQKRFREVQLKLYSDSENLTEFGTAFLVDGVWRRNYLKLQETLTDENKVSLLPALDLNTFATELTMTVMDDGTIAPDKGSDAIELTDWTLDFSHFKREAPVTVRIPVSGKGFNPRFIFMAPKAVGLTINEINWVYRLMHGR